ncbi:helicase, partial [bacterium]|nr:helicase [bacterium]
IEDVAVNYLGCKFSNRQLDYLLNQLHKPKGSSGLIEKLFADDTQTQLLQLVKAVRQANAVFSEEILSNTGTESTVRMRENISLTDHLSDPITDLCDSLKENLILIKEEDDKTEIEGMVRRLDAIKNSLSLIINRKLKDSVYWIETNQFNKNTHIALNASPIDIAPILKEKVFDITRPSVLVSATLAVGKSFNFHRERLGLDDAKELMLSSPFDYEKQVGLYVSDKLPHPQNKKVDFENGLTKKIHHIIDVMQGRTLVLFTSYKMMENVFENLINTVNGVTLLKQGDLPRWQLLEALKETDDTILLGTNSFWQGIDLPGKSLECVVITKLPFAVPNHPLTEARLEDIEHRGKNPFMDYQVPQAVLMLKQGFGRLIRHRNDKGLIIILDPRIKTQRYGKIFLDSLPKCRMIEQLDHIEDVFTSLNN